MALSVRPRALAAAALAAAATVALSTDASAATLHLKAPREIERAEPFRVTAWGKAKPNRDYWISVIYHDDDQGRCARTVEKEITRNEHHAVFYLRRVRADGEGGFRLRSRKIVGGDRRRTGRFCGYLTNRSGERSRDRAVRRISFT